MVTKIVRKILFLCQDNACLSPVAEAIAVRLCPPQIQIFSAGVIPGPVDKATAEKLAECGINVPWQGKGVETISRDDVDLIIVLGSLDGPVPAFPSKTRWEYWPVLDPRTEAGMAKLESIRRVIADLCQRVAGLFLDYRRGLRRGW
jgi:arsenate reductase (thioredoxin)